MYRDDPRERNSVNADRMIAQHWSPAVGRFSPLA
jgi:hypothetical protein